MATRQTQTLARALLSPAVLLLFIWMIVPLVLTIYFSTLHYSLLDPGSEVFVGLENFRYFLTDPAFIASLENTLVLVGSAPLNALDASHPRPDVRPLGDRAFWALEPDRSRPGGCTLVLGAETARGFDRLKRFARVNRDGFGSEPNRPFVLLAN